MALPGRNKQTEGVHQSGKQQEGVHDSIHGSLNGVLEGTRLPGRHHQGLSQHIAGMNSRTQTNSFLPNTYQSSAFLGNPNVHMNLGIQGMVHNPVDLVGMGLPVGGQPRDAMGVLQPSAFPSHPSSSLLSQATQAQMIDQARANLLQQQMLLSVDPRAMALQGRLGQLGQISQYPALNQVSNFPQQLGSQNQDMTPRNRPNALEALGSSLRSKSDPYIDVSSLEDPDPQDCVLRRTRGGVSEPFPEKLQRMLREAEVNGLDDVVSFYSHGRAFGVHDIDRFAEEVMPKYFKQSKWNSFARQLNLYGFQRISTGPDSGGYYHELFLKGRPTLCLHMRRVGVPQGEDRRKFKVKNAVPDPDFYSMKPVVPLVSSRQSSLAAAPSSISNNTSLPGEH